MTVLCSMMDENISLVTDVVWIKRGVPKAVPDKVKLSNDEIRDLIEG